MIMFFPQVFIGFIRNLAIGRRRQTFRKNSYAKEAEILQICIFNNSFRSDCIEWRYVREDKLHKMAFI